MRSGFAEFFPVPSDELETLWAEGVVVLDANVLLGVYRYASDARKALLAVLSARQDRLWVPHQFATEYHRNRLDVIADQARDYKAIRERVQKIVDELKSDRAPFAQAESVDALARLVEELRNEGDGLLDLLTAGDVHRDALVKLLDGRVGMPPEAPSEGKMMEHAKARYMRELPPGKRDEKKGDPRMYGDCIGWLQILEHMEKQRKPCILVTDDRKDDWWLTAGGRTIGPRHELVREYQDRCGARFHMYVPSQFLRWASERGVDVSAKAINELELLEQRGTAEEAGGSTAAPVPSRELDILEEKRARVRGG